jgi:iron complex transport system permease protein
MSAVAVVPARRANGRLIAALAVCLVLIATLGLLNFVRGAPNVALAEVWRAVAAPADGASQAHFLIRELRIPRVLLATVCGLALGLVGVLLQDSLRNPLADPGLLGIAQGAGFATALSAIYPEVVPDLPQPLLCLIAGLLVGAVVVAFSGTIHDPVRVILTGAICSGFFGVLTSAVLLLAPYDRSAGIGSYLRYVSGSVSAAEWSQLWMVAPWLALGIPAALLSGRALNLLQLGDELASGAGLNPFRARLLLIFIALLLMSPVIAAVGPVAFVALFAPHIARGLLVSSDARQVLLLSGLCGAALLLAADTAGRLLFFPIEIPAGIWTVAIIGPATVAVVGRMTRRLAR